MCDSAGALGGASPPSPVADSGSGEKRARTRRWCRQLGAMRWVAPRPNGAPRGPLPNRKIGGKVSRFLLTKRPELNPELVIPISTQVVSSVMKSRLANRHCQFFWQPQVVIARIVRHEHHLAPTPLER